jgi:hypothetical protein
LQKIEKELSHSLSPNPEERTYKKEDLYWGADKDVTRARLWEFGDALSELERIKSRLPQTYQTYLTRILGSSERIREVFTEYRKNHPDKRQPGGLAAYQPGDVVPVHQQLRELDPDRFPLNLIDISDKEFERLGYSAVSARDPNESMFPRARLAEYDPERFRRVWGPEYPPAQLPRHRKFFEDKAAHGNPRGMDYLKTWQTIERVLSESPEYLQWALGEIDAALARALSDNPAETYKSDGQQADATEARFYDLRNALQQLDLIKSRPPEAYSVQKQRILEKVNEIRQLFADYRRNHPDNYRAGDVVSVHRALQKLDPQRFPLNFIDISDSEFKSLSIPSIQGNRAAYPRSHAELAEYDPEKFRRVFGPQYGFGGVPRKRKEFEDRAEDIYRNGGVESSADPKDWQTIERVLTETQTL